MVVGVDGRHPDRHSGSKFSASNTLPDVRRYGATMLTYTGKVLNYVLATPEQPDDADSPLRLAIGNEASARDISEFARRFGATVRDSYGSTEGIIIIRRDPSMPANALGTADDSVRVMNAETGAECPPVRLRAGWPADQSRRGGRRNRRDRAHEWFRGLLQERGGDQRAFPRRLVLVGRPRLPRRRRLALFRRPIQRMAAGRRGELRRRTGRGDRELAIPTCAQLRCTRCPTTRSATG